MPTNRTFSALLVTFLGRSLDDTSNNLELQAQSIKIVNSSLDTDGLFFSTLNLEATMHIRSLATECLGNSDVLVDVDIAAIDCLRRWPDRAADSFEQVIRAIEYKVLGHIIGTSQRASNERASNEGVMFGRVSCSRSRVVVFARWGSRPQNMHLDEVKPTDDLNFRVWMPLDEVTDAPMVLVNSLHIYSSREKRLESVNVEGFPSTQSAGSRIVTRDEFVDDCARNAEIDRVSSLPACAPIHTIGLAPGDFVAFRNAEVLHGTASHGNGRRVAIAVDCAAVL